MMRYSMRWTSEFARLRDELNHIVHYVNIVNLRFDGLVNLVLDVPEALGGQELLKMSLQPLVENAVKHGFRGLPLTVGIRAEAADGAIRIVVSDDGAGISPEQAEALNRKLARDDAAASADPAAGPDDGDGSRPGGIGLVNVHRRIQMHYGKEYGLRVERTHGLTRVEIRIPHTIRSEGEDVHARALDRG
jgi:two-component system sensor histidine kinase YesM